MPKTTKTIFRTHRAICCPVNIETNKRTNELFPCERYIFVRNAEVICMVITLSNITHMRTRQLSHKCTAYRADAQTAYTCPQRSTRSVPCPLFFRFVALLCIHGSFSLSPARHMQLIFRPNVAVPMVYCMCRFIPILNSYSDEAL